jgi:hypothetical protein
VSFDEDRPAFIYTHVKYDIKFAEHPLASRMPKPTATPATFDDPAQFSCLMRREDGPTRIEDYLYKDEPQLSLHISSFLDATWVCLSWPHTFLDAMGRKALLEAWCLVLQGRDDEVAPLHGVTADPLVTLGDKATEAYKNAHLMLSPLQMMLFGVRYAFESWWWEDETRVICIPASYMEDLREVSKQYLATTSGDKEKFHSDGDILTAWLARLGTTHIPQDSNRTVYMQNAYGLRAVLSKDLLPSSSAYISNAVMQVHAILPANELIGKPIGYVASAIRRGVRELGSREQIEAFAALGKATAKKGYPPLFGDSSMHLFTVSNWTKAKFFETDFSAAVVKEGTAKDKRDNKSGAPSMVLATGYSNGFSLRNSFPILGKDAAGNYWAWGTVRKGFWAAMDRRLKEELHVAK